VLVKVGDLCAEFDRLCPHPVPVCTETFHGGARRVPFGESQAQARLGIRCSSGRFAIGGRIGLERPLRFLGAVACSGQLGAQPHHFTGGVVSAQRLHLRTLIQLQVLPPPLRKLVLGVLEIVLRQQETRGRLIADVLRLGQPGPQAADCAFVRGKLCRPGVHVGPVSGQFVEPKTSLQGGGLGVQCAGHCGVTLLGQRQCTSLRGRTYRLDGGTSAQPLPARGEITDQHVAAIQLGAQVQQLTGSITQRFFEAPCFVGELLCVLFVRQNNPQNSPKRETDYKRRCGGNPTSGRALPCDPDREASAKLRRVSSDPHLHPLPDLQGNLSKYLARVRRRALGVELVRGVLVGIGAAATTVLLAAVWVGAVSPTWFSVLAAMTSAATLGGIAWRVARPNTLASRAWLGTKLDAVSAGLGSRTLSAVELTQGPPQIGHSLDLVHAHATHAWEQLRLVPVEQVVPMNLARDSRIHVSAALLAAVCLVSVGSSRVRLGLAALVHPSPLDETGARLGDVVKGLEVRLRFPSYLNRADETLTDVHELQVPRGTHLEVVAESRINSDEVELRVAKVALPLQPQQESRRYAGTFVARESGLIAVRLRDGGSWVQDRQERRLMVTADAPPVVEFVAPTEGEVVAADAILGVEYRTSDDAGLASVELVVRGPAGLEQRRRLWSSGHVGPAQRQLNERATLLASELMARPGDVVTLWLEATDHSAIAGPNLTRSLPRHVEIASDAGDKQKLREGLREVLDRALDALADRLEEAPATEANAARRRYQNAADKTQSFISTLSSWNRFAQSQTINTTSGPVARADLEAMRTMQSRHRQLAVEEAQLHEARLAALGQRAAVDARCVSALERDTLFVSDLLGRTHLAEAEALTAELDQLRKQLTELMAQMESSDNAQAKVEILAAIQRAQSRLAKLMQSLASLSDHVPSEFVNADALRPDSASGSLSKMEAALNANDLAGAQEQLAALSRDVEELQRALRDGSMSFTNERFGPRNEALNAARAELASLTEQQQRLAARSGERLKRLSERWQEQHGPNPMTQSLQAKAAAAREALDTIDRKNLGGAEAQALDRVAQRLSDTAAALKTGDLLEAQRMAELASDDARALQHDLDIMGRMFPGPRGETAQNAARAKRATSSIDALRSSLQRSAPDLAAEMNEGDQRAVRGDADPQQHLREDTDRLAQTLEGTPEGSPLHGEGAQSLRNAERAMQRAERALRGAEPAAAASAQEEARDALQAANDAMRGDPSRGQGDGDSQGQQSGQDGNDGSRGHVQLPEHARQNAQARRQKLLDGMRDPTPRGYESAVERYYRELLE